MLFTGYELQLKNNNKRFLDAGCMKGPKVLILTCGDLHLSENEMWPRITRQTEKPTLKIMLFTGRTLLFPDLVNFP